MEDLMNDQELHRLGLQALVPWLEGHNFTIDFMQEDKYVVPHIFALSGKIMTVIVAASDMYPNRGTVSEGDKAAALKVAGELHALCAVASIGLVNIDGLASGDKELMSKPLKSGHYKADFRGLEYIQFED